MVLKRISMMITILGFVLIWFGINQSNDILLIVAIALLFTGLSGMYWGFRNMRGSGLLYGNRLFYVVAGILILIVLVGMFLRF